MTGTDVRVGSYRWLLNQQTLVTIKKVDNLYVIDDIISPIEEIE